MSVTQLNDTLFKYLNYFHQDDRINRFTLGMHRNATLRDLRRWKFSDIVLLAVLVVLYFAVYRIDPFQRQFVVNDVTINHPFAEHERVNNAGLFFLAVWIPSAVVCSAALVITKPRNKLYVAYVSVLGLWVAVFTTSVVTDVLKNFIGRHRPDFIARCQPRADAPRDVLVFAKDVCTTEDLGRLKDGFRTTPSGHSSLSFAGLLYLSLWLGGQLVVASEESGSWRSVVAGVPTLGAMVIALSRTEDYRHHFVDVIIGSLLGSLIGYWSYRRQFPGLSHPKSYEPYEVIREDYTSENGDAGPSNGYNRLDDSLPV